MNIALVVPHIFMQDALLRDVIFSPADLAIDLGEQLQLLGHNVTLYTPGRVETTVRNSTGDLSGFETELELRGYGYIELLKKHPLTFATLARQVQADLIAQVFEDANNGTFDIVHVYTNEEDIGLHFARFCKCPVVFTHHDPFNLTVGYKYLFPQKKDLNLIAVSDAQKTDMPTDTNWVATIPHGLPEDMYYQDDGSGGYIAYLGRIIASKGVHHAIDAVNRYNDQADTPITLKIAGKRYHDSYYEDYIKPRLTEHIEFVGFLRTTAEKQSFLGRATATIVPSVFKEPFGMVVIESLACGTPVIGLNSGAIPEIITHAQDGYIAKSDQDDDEVAEEIASLLEKVKSIPRDACRQTFERHYTSKHMTEAHVAAYQKLIE